MKKRTTLLCLMATFLTLGACSTKKVDTKAVDSLNQAITHVVSLTSVKTNAKILMDAPESNIVAKLELNFELIMKDKLQMKMNVNGSANGIRLDDIASIYIKDDMMYTDIIGKGKEKIEIGSSTINKDIKKQPFVLSNTAIEKICKEVTMKEENGDKIIHIVPTDAIVTNMITGTKEQLKDKKDIGFDTIKDVSFDVILTKDNKLKNALLNFNVVYKDLKKTPAQAIPMNIKIELLVSELKYINDN